MDRSASYAAISAWASWAAVVCALLVVWVQNRAAKRLTCLQLFMQLAAQYDSVDMQRARARLAAQLLADPTTLAISDSLLVFYENIAALHRRGLLDSELMDNTFSIDVICYWAALKHYVRRMRAAFDDSGVFTEFERLAEYFMKVTRPQDDPASSLGGVTPGAVEQFLRGEALRGDERA